MKEMKDISLGLHFDMSWILKSYNMPVIRLYVALMYHFENLTKATDVNLVASVPMLDIMESAQTSNVYEIVEKFN